MDDLAKVVRQLLRTSILSSSWFWGVGVNDALHVVRGRRRREILYPSARVSTPVTSVWSDSRSCC